MLYNNLDNNCLKINSIENINYELMEHQKTAIYAMIEMEKNKKVIVKNIKCLSNTSEDIEIETNIGILSDRVGSGKTLMITCLLLLDLFKNTMPQEINEYYEMNKYYRIKKLEKKEYRDINLIIVPTNLLKQWKELINKYISDNYFEIDYELKETSKNIIITSDNTKFFDINKNIMWKRIIIDEADSIKLKDFNILANFIWLITGTPNGLVYNQKPYIKKIFGKNKDWIIEYIQVKNNNDFVDLSIKLPKPNRIMINCHTPIELKIINDNIPKNIINMINAGNIDDAKKILNYNEDTQDNIINIITKNIKQAIKNKELEIEYENKKLVSNNSLLLEKEKKIKKIKKVIERLNERLNSIKEKINNYQDEICMICLNEIDTPCIVNCCNNIFCFECITLLTTKTGKCQKCLRNIKKSNIKIISNNPKEQEKLPTKQDTLLNIINKNTNHKYLIFANFNESINQINNILEKNNIKATKNIDDYLNNKINILILNASNNGAGFNLQNTNSVIIYHRFTKEIEEQVIGRANRLGRNNPLNIFYLLHENESISVNSKYNEIDFNDYLEL
jgi:hypothetical protein